MYPSEILLISLKFEGVVFGPVVILDTPSDALPTQARRDELLDVLATQCAACGEPLPLGRPMRLCAHCAASREWVQN